MAKAAQFDDEPFFGQKPDMAPSKAHLNVSEELRSSSLSLNKSRMVMDEDRFEDQFLRCGICKTRFSMSSLPRLLPCHHSYCQPCVLRLYQTAKEHRQSFQSSLRTTTPTLTTVSVNCPTCRTNFVATDENILKLPADHRVVQLMDFVKHTEKYTISFCSKHNLQPLNFFCEPCIRPVCRDCTVVDHKESDGHLVMDLEEAMSKYTPLLDTAIAEMDAEVLGMEEKMVALETLTKGVDKVKSELIAENRACMARLRNLITEREKTLEAKIHLEIEKEKTKLREKKESLVSQKEKVETQTGRLKKAKEESNVEDIFHIHQEVKEYMKNSVKIRDVNDGSVASISLNTRDESLLASRINSFGDIITKDDTTVSRPKSILRHYYRNSSAY